MSILGTVSEDANADPESNWPEEGTYQGGFAWDAAEYGRRRTTDLV